VASVVGLLEARELAARERVEGLREEADRVLAELAEAETDWEGWVIARQRVGEVLAAPPEWEVAVAAPVPADGSCGPQAVAETVVTPAVETARPGSVVPVWRPGLEAGVLAVDYQRILDGLAGKLADGSGVMSCQEMALGLGLEPSAASVEGVRCRAERLVDRGWPAEPAPGRFTLAAGPAAGS
jgi:hypothetical protein